ncbi:MAG TPA: DUF4203 domain-containing protein [Thermomicrobiales bacterium]|jgi:hypothetical protein
MGDILVGLVVLVLGLAVCFAGLPLFMVTLPIWGFIAGFFVGAAGWEALLGDGFLRTVTGWIVGLIVGLVFALLSYFFWYAGAIIAAASVGAMAGSGLMAAFNVDSDWIVFIVAAIGAVIVGLIAVLLSLPVYIVLVETAFLGAVGVITGIMLIFNQIDTEDLGHGATWSMINDSWFWVLAWIVLAGAGLLAQMRGIREFRLPDDRWTRAEMAPQV